MIFQGKNGPLLIAEIGGNHEGNFDIAIKQTNLAIKSGCDVVKYQMYKGETLVNPKEDFQRYEHFKKFELKKEQYIKLAEICKKNKVIFSASIWDTSMISWVDKYLKFYKIGSGDLTSYPILEKFCEKKKPIILSTGLSTLSEINNSVNFIAQQNKFYKKKNNLVIMQCTSSYPCSDKDLNLNVIDTFKKQYNYLIGYSDHSIGNLALLTAYIKGAQVLEFHFTHDKNRKFRDHGLSLDIYDVKKLISDISTINSMLGSKVKKPTKNEIKSGHIKSFRRSMYIGKDLRKGKKIDKSSIVCLRPQNSHSPTKYPKFLDKRLAKKNYKKFDRI
jgi:N-acetylneuraminate synthase/N,N'-diacetyllegionaminate synthase